LLQDVTTDRVNHDMFLIKLAGLSYKHCNIGFSLKTN